MSTSADGYARLQRLLHEQFALLERDAIRHCASRQGLRALLGLDQTNPYAL